MARWGHGCDVQLMQQILDSIPAELAGWAAVLAGLGLFVLLLARIEQRTQARAPKLVEPVTPAPQAGFDWHTATADAARDLARASELASIQTRAALQIDAVEHAYNRMLAQCATVLDLGTAQPLEPAVAPAREPEMPARQPLAA
jgi:hypothetical protein